MTVNTAFRYRNATSGRLEVAGGPAANEFWHPVLPTCLYPAGGMLAVLNGWNLNRRLLETAEDESIGSDAVALLQIPAPSDTLSPMVSAVGAGRCFRRGAKWRYRWYNSTTGEFSGLSPVPEFSFDLGVQTPAGGTTYLGQKVWFNIATSGAPTGADTIQLFANGTSNEDVWYMADEGSIGSLSYVQLEDNNPDDDLFLKEYVSYAAPSGPSWVEGVMPPVAKATAHPTGRTLYFGVRRFASLRQNATNATVATGSTTVTIDNTANIPRIVEPGRVGQRIRFFRATTGFADPIRDPTAYRIASVTNGYTLEITPELQVSLDAAVGANNSYFWAIEDDRDARRVDMSEPGRPWLIDPRKAVYVGADSDDGVLAWFYLGGQSFAQTRKGIFSITNDVTEDPSLSMYVRQVSDEGCVGFEACASTPFGWVFVHPTLGIRLFDGAAVVPLGRGVDAFSDFSPTDQFRNFSAATMEDVRVVYDIRHHELYVSYVPDGAGSFTEALVFSAPDRAWRGPYRERLVCGGLLRTTSGDEEFVAGDDAGNLYTHNEQSLDLVPTITTGTTTGTLTAVTNARMVKDSGNNFTADSDDRLRGMPIWFSDGTTYYFSRIIALLSDVGLELDGPPINETSGAAATPAIGWTYGIGTIRWSLTTAYIDAGEPSLQKIARLLRMRFKRGTDATTFEIGCAEDGNGSYNGERVSALSAPVFTVAPAGSTSIPSSPVFCDARLERQGVCFQVRVRGVARSGEPRITTAILTLEVLDGKETS